MSYKHLCVVFIIVIGLPFVSNAQEDGEKEGPTIKLGFGFDLKNNWVQGPEANFQIEIADLLLEYSQYDDHTITSIGNFQSGVGIPTRQETDNSVTAITIAYKFNNERRVTPYLGIRTYKFRELAPNGEFIDFDIGTPILGFDVLVFEELFLSGDFSRFTQTFNSSNITSGTEQATSLTRTQTVVRFSVKYYFTTF